MSSERKVLIVEDEPHTLELAYHFHTSAWGQGFATEAASACVNWALDTGAARKTVAYTGAGISAAVMPPISRTATASAWRMPALSPHAATPFSCREGPLLN